MRRTVIPFVPGRAVWAWVVDGLHNRLVEDVCVQVDPEPVRWSAVTSQEGHSLAGGAFGTGPADVLAVEDQHVRRQRLAAAAFPVGGSAAGEHGHVAVAHERPPWTSARGPWWRCRGLARCRCPSPGWSPFHNEKADIFLDGQQLEQPKTHFFPADESQEAHIAREATGSAEHR